MIKKKKKLPANAGGSRDVGSIPGLGRCLKKKWWPTPGFLSRKCCGQRISAGYTAHGSAKSQAWLSSQNLSGLPRWLSGKESTCRCRRHRFNPWGGKIPWRRKRQPTLVFMPGKSHGQRSLVGYRVRHNLASEQQQISLYKSCTI